VYQVICLPPSPALRVLVLAILVYYTLHDVDLQLDRAPKKDMLVVQVLGEAWGM